MRTIQRRYKTLKGFMKARGINDVPLYEVLDGAIKYDYKDKKLRRFKLTLSDDARKQVADLMADLWSKSYRKRVVEKVMDKTADNSYVQCFYLQHYFGKYSIGTSLSGPNYDYCKRMWLKS